MKRVCRPGLKVVGGVLLQRAGARSLRPHVAAGG